MGTKTHEVLTHDEKGTYAWYVWCPACNTAHGFRVDTWQFDGNHEAPTFTASMLRHAEGCGRATEGKGCDCDRKPGRCHSFLKAGVWEYLADSGHEFAGQKVPAPDWGATRWARMDSHGVVRTPQT